MTPAHWLSIAALLFCAVGVCVGLGVMALYVNQRDKESNDE
jgi:hypothetical protein